RARFASPPSRSERSPRARHDRPTGPRAHPHPPHWPTVGRRVHRSLSAPRLHVAARCDPRPEQAGRRGPPPRTVPAPHPVVDGAQPPPPHGARPGRLLAPDPPRPNRRGRRVERHEGARIVTRYTNLAAFFQGCSA